MVDNDTAALPDGTDTVIEGAATMTVATIDGDRWRMPTIGDCTREIPAPAAMPSGRRTAAAIRHGAWPIASAADVSSSPARRANELAAWSRQGLERTAETLANVSKMVGDTAPGIEERLGPEYGDYARRAAGCDRECRQYNR